MVGMQSLSEVRKLDNYLLEFLSTKGFKELNEICQNILNYEHVNGLEDYSKALIALALEKKIVIAVEKDRQKNKRPSYWEELKNPYNNQTNSLFAYINLAIRDLKEPIPKDQHFEEIQNFYDIEIYKASRLFMNRLFGLPSGQKASINDLITAIENTFNISEDTKKEFKITKVKGKLKSAAAITGLVTVMGISMLNNSESKANDSIKNMETDEDYIEMDISKNSNYKENEVVEEKLNIVEKNEPIAESNLTLKNEEVLLNQTTFIGYDCMCPKELQEYIYKIDKEYGVPFNVHMTILDNESGGYFNNNGVKNSTKDYGFAQINECNLKQIEEYLGYTKDDILNNPYKNIEASAWLLRDICQKYQDEIKKGDYENIFGAYNGWVDWKKKPLAVEYANKAMEKLDNKYNKTEEELYENVIAYIDGENNGKGL